MNATINEISKDKCTGCGACKNICPVNAIRMERNDEGFLFPKIDEENCIHCGKCYHVCSVNINNEDFHTRKKIPDYYAARGKKELVCTSSSGGMFSVIAEEVLRRGGAICGCRWSEDYQRAYHTIVESVEDLEALRKSKYIQSDIGDVYTAIRNILNEKRWVLFSGTPCQVAGLYAFLGRDYQSLITVDIICHGVPSLKAYHSWLKQYTGGRKIEQVNFRDKSRAHWGTVEYIKFQDGSVYYDDCFHGLWYKAFLGGISTRKCCGTCKYANISRIGDFTLGDFWGIANILPDFDDGYGTSLVSVNTEKAQNFFKHIRKNIKYEQVPQEKVIEIAKKHNGNLLKSTPSHWARRRFFELLDTKCFSDAVIWTMHAKYDVGVVGWWYNLNYGGTLTYYALHQVLRKLGYSVLMINRTAEDPDYKPDTKTIPYKFALKHYYISKPYSRKDIYMLNDHCEAFISGSDQLFNPLLWTWSGPEYFLNFVNGKNRKIGYASSFGNSYEDDKNLTGIMKYWIRRLDYLSVREDYAVDIARDVFDAQADHVLDPVFLCDVQDYLDVAAESKSEEKGFSVNFFLDPSEEKRQIITYAREILNKDYVNLINADHVEENIRKMHMDNVKAYAPVEDWLYYYSNADFVITDSFHGTCFAIIFHKPFISIANTQRGENRFISLLKELNLMDRLVYSFDEIKEKEEQLFQPVDFTQADQILQNRREESLLWLKNAISGPRKNDDFKMLDDRIFDLQRKVARLEYLLEEKHEIDK